MGRQKQQVISRFFTPRSPSQPCPPSSVPASSHPDPSPSSTNPPIPTPTPTPTPIPPPKISNIVDFSPSKRARLSPHLLSPSSSPQQSQKPKLSSPHTQNPFPSSPSRPSPTLHRKFLQRLVEPPDHLLEPSHEKPPTLPIANPPIGQPTSTITKYTPLEQQVVDLKAKYPDVILMIEVGYRYRFFGIDAEIAARALGIYAHVDHNFLTASVPTFKLNVHVRRLVAEGYKVGVVKQTETASIKAHGANRLGPFSRGLSALYTKATIEAAEDLGGGGDIDCGTLNNYLFCVVDREVIAGSFDLGSRSGIDVEIGVVAVEVSTGDVIYGEFNDDVTRSMLEAVVLSLSPVELLLGEPLSKQTKKLLSTYAGPASNIRVEFASLDASKDGGDLAELIFAAENDRLNCNGAHPNKNSSELREGTQDMLVKKIMEMPELAVQAMTIILHHLKKFGLDRTLSLGASFRPLSSNMEMSLSANTLRQLEVLRNNSDGSETGSLLHHMNHTLTIFGSRLLQHWVTHPLCDRSMILARLDAVAEISEFMGGDIGLDGVERGRHDFTICRPDVYGVLSSVLTNLGRSTDIQRRLMRIMHRTITPFEFIAVVRAILFAGKQLQQLCIEGIKDTKEVHVVIRSALLRKLIQSACPSSLISNAVKLLSYLNTEAADKKDQINLINASDVQFPEIAHSRTKLQSANEKLESLIDLYRKQLGMRSLEFMSVSGLTHLLELPTEARVPPRWVKVNSTKKTVRYHTPEVLAALDELSLANEEQAIVCRNAWSKFLDEFTEHYCEFKAAVEALAALDCLLSLAVISKNKNYVRPVFVDDKEPVQIQITSGRHPVLETMLHDNFVPNDTHLNADKEYCQIVTGPNMGGKSCYIRQVALIAIMAQVGSFVPAAFAQLHVVDAIHTRMGASDNILQGRSTFLEELSEASLILKTCTSRSLVIMDELGRGTSTHDGVAIAYATLHHLLAEKRCMVLFVTHYPEIDDIKKEFPGSVRSYHVSYQTSKSGDGSDMMTTTDRIESEDNITYLYKVVPGISGRSFGFKVAQLAQLPSSCIKRGMEMAGKLEKLVQRRVVEKQGVKLSDEEQLLLLGPICEGVSCSASLDGNLQRFLCCLKSALGDDDQQRSFESLKGVRRLAVEIMRLERKDSLETFSM